MAPTEVLATQHYKELSKLFEPYGIRVGMLIGSLTAKEKRLTQEQIKNGDIDVVVGTHALISEKAVYKNLGLVVTDEQHRFGVKQREKLSEKGNKPHTLVMSATPIPRTLAIIMYGDLDISIIDELPAGRKPIKNCVVDESYRLTAQKFIVSQVDAGHQVYIVCPMVDESENMDDVANVMDYSQELSSSLKENFNRDLSIACLHGKMKAAEKNEIMESFSKGDISVLVSTTVIEVGVNNPNATLMMVENAERFGLAQLHQLRGRVGRGDSQSYCIFMSAKKDDATRERLNVLVESNDGFYIAGEDLKMRGPGDFFGVRQSGESMFTMGDIYNHADMLKAAQEIYERYGSLVEQNLSQAEYKDMILNPVL
jgi:ATP-dependent DNA helicase RecG